MTSKTGSGRSEELDAWDDGAEFTVHTIQLLSISTSTH